MQSNAPTILTFPALQYKDEVIIWLDLHKLYG